MSSGPKQVRIRAIAIESLFIAGLGVLSLSLPILGDASAAMPGPERLTANDDEAFGEESPAVQQRTAMIEADIKKAPGHAWAGKYYEGDGLGSNIQVLVSPISGVAATWHGCLGLYGANEGLIRTDPGGTLHFVFNRTNKDQFGGFPDDVVPVRWGERRYLVPPPRMSEFVAAINQGDEPRTHAQGMFLMADGDERSSVAGLPNLPDKYQRRIRTQPLTGRVLRVELLEPRQRFEKMCDKRYRIDLEVGGEGVLASGDVLKLTAPRNTFSSLTVESAALGSAIGVAEVMELDCAKPENVPDRSWVFSTGAYDAIAANRRISIERARSEDEGIDE